MVSAFGNRPNLPVKMVLSKIEFKSDKKNFSELKQNVVLAACHFNNLVEAVDK